MSHRGVRPTPPPFKPPPPLFQYIPGAALWIWLSLSCRCFLAKDRRVRAGLPSIVSDWQSTDAGSWSTGPCRADAVVPEDGACLYGGRQRHADPPAPHAEARAPALIPGPAPAAPSLAFPGPAPPPWDCICPRAWHPGRQWKGERCPRPPSPSRQLPASMAFVTDCNRPQPLSQPPPAPYPTASGAATAALSLLPHPCWHPLPPRKCHETSESPRFAVPLRRTPPAHPSPFPQIYDHYPASDDSKYAALVTELAQKSLPEHLLSPAFEPGSLPHVIECLVRALQELHAAGVVFGDVCPAKVVKCGEVWKLGDLGAARLVGEALPNCFAPHHCPPEMARWKAGGMGEPLQAHPSYDVWALGVTIHELVGPQKLFGGMPDDAVFALLRSRDLPAHLAAATTAHPVLKVWPPRRRPSSRSVASGCSNVHGWPLPALLQRRVLLYPPVPRPPPPPLLQELGWRCFVAAGSQPVLLSLIKLRKGGAATRANTPVRSILFT